MSKTEKIYMTWDKFDKDIQEFIEYLNTFGFNKDVVIIGLERGGLPTSTALSNKMNIPISIISFQTRDGNDVLPQFLEPNLIKNAKKIIIPDDIYDTGLTIETIVKELEEQFNKTLDDIVGLFHYASDKIFKSRLKFYRILDNNEGKWVVFPWE